MQSRPPLSRKAAIAIVAIVFILGIALSLYLLFAPAIENQRNRKAIDGGASSMEPATANPQQTTSNSKTPLKPDASIAKPGFAQDVQAAHAAMKCLNLAS